MLVVSNYVLSKPFDNIQQKCVTGKFQNVKTLVIKTKYRFLIVLPVSNKNVQSSVFVPISALRLFYQFAECKKVVHAIVLTCGAMKLFCVPFPLSRKISISGITLQNNHSSYSLLPCRPALAIATLFSGRRPIW